MNSKKSPRELVIDRERRPGAARALRQAIAESAEIPNLSDREIHDLRQRVRELIDKTGTVSVDESEQMLMEILHSPGEAHYLSRSEPVARHYLQVMEVLYEHLARKREARVRRS